MRRDLSTTFLRKLREREEELQGTQETQFASAIASSHTYRTALTSYVGRENLRGHKADERLSAALTAFLATAERAIPNEQEQEQEVDDAIAVLDQGPPFRETARRRSLIQELSYYRQMTEDALPDLSEEALQERIEGAIEEAIYQEEVLARSRVHWTDDDRANLVDGVQQFGTNFAAIFEAYAFSPGLTIKKLKVTYYNTLQYRTQPTQTV